MEHAANRLSGGHNQYSPLERGTWREAMLNTIKRFLREEDGPTATEYAVMLALIIVVAIASVSTLGSKVNEIFTGINDQLDSVGN